MGKISQLLKKLKKKGKSFFNPKKHCKYIFAWYYKYGRIRENQVLFESFHGKTISDSPYYMMKELLKTNKEYKIYYSTSDYEQHKKFIKENHLNIKLVKINTRAYQYAMATSKYLINNSSFPSYYIRKDEQIYFQTWHGIPLKTLGKNMRRGIASMFNVQHNFLQANYLMFPNEFTRDCIMKDYNLDSLYTGKVVLSGYPRNSIFLDKEAANSLRKRLNLEDKTIYAYMPTWRGENSFDIASSAYETEICSMLSEIDGQLKDNQILFVNLHPIMRQRVSISTYKHIKEFPADVDNYEFLNCCDALITDYSSVFFDYSITRKPIILFMYDYEEYMSTRGTYFEANTLPFKKIYHIKDLIESLVSEQATKEFYTDEAYFEKFVKYDTIDASKKLVDYIFNGDSGDMLIEDYAHNEKIERHVIYPMNVRSRGKLIKLCEETEGKNEIIILEKKWFKDELNELIYTEFNDKINYIVIFPNVVNTYMEAILLKIGSQKIKKELINRGLKRCIPNLTVSNHYEKLL